MESLNYVGILSEVRLEYYIEHYIGFGGGYGYYNGSGDIRHNVFEYNRARAVLMGQSLEIRQTGRKWL